MTQNHINFIFCVVLGTIVALLLLATSKQPIDVYITCEEIEEGLSVKYGNEKNEAKEKAVKKAKQD